MDDTDNFMTWEEIAEIHQMGFEIGNHSWTHSDFSQPKNAARLAGETALVENELRKVNVPKPISFAYCGNSFGPEATRKLHELGFQFARRGAQPEVPYGKKEVGSNFDPQKHHLLLIPTTADAYPDWTLNHFKVVVNQAKKGEVVVLQFHGVPDIAHRWVHTPPDQFREYMNYLKENNFRVIALKDVEKYLPVSKLVHEGPDSTLSSLEVKNTSPNLIVSGNSLLSQRVPVRNVDEIEWPQEVVATRSDLKYWLDNMINHHRFSWKEAAQVAGMDPQELRQKAIEVEANFITSDPLISNIDHKVKILPYPGGRHPRIGFLDGEIDPHRGTKASIFLPWNPADYIIVDLPEAIFSQLGLTYLAHTHIPTIWDEKNVVLENHDWERLPDGSLKNSWTLPNQITFGASIKPGSFRVEMDLWLKNETSVTLKDMRTQICIMFKGARQFSQQTNENKLFRQPVAAVKSESANRWILTAWEHCGRVWGNTRCPCLHSDPVLPECKPGETVRVRGMILFYVGDDIEGAIERAQEELSSV